MIETLYINVFGDTERRDGGGMKFEKLTVKQPWTAPVVRILAASDALVRTARADDRGFDAAVRERFPHAL